MKTLILVLAAVLLMAHVWVAHGCVQEKGSCRKNYPESMKCCSGLTCFTNKNGDGRCFEDCSPDYNPCTSDSDCCSNNCREDISGCYP